MCITANYNQNYHSNQKAQLHTAATVSLEREQHEPTFQQEGSLHTKQTDYHSRITCKCYLSLQFCEMILLAMLTHSIQTTSFSLPLIVQTLTVPTHILLLSMGLSPWPERILVEITIFHAITFKIKAYFSTSSRCPSLSQVCSQFN